MREHNRPMSTSPSTSPSTDQASAQEREYIASNNRSIGYALSALALFCYLHAVIWFALREPLAAASDPFVGAEGMVGCATLLLGTGAYLIAQGRKRSPEHSTALKR